MQWIGDGRPIDDDDRMQGIDARSPIDDDDRMQGIDVRSPIDDYDGMQGIDARGPIDDDATDTADDADPLSGPEPQLRRMHGDIPIRGYNRGEPIPDLGRLGQERWREALIPLSPYTRQLAKATVRSIPDAIAVNELVGDLIVSAPMPSLAAAPPPLPRAVADPPARGSRHQVNFRLSADEHARLTSVARAFGLRPGPLARLLTVRGVERVLYEERRDG